MRSVHPRRWQLLAGVVAAFLATVVPVAAMGFPPPRHVELRIAGLDQNGSYVWEEWTSRSGAHSCVISSGDGRGNFPRPLAVEPGRYWARFVFRTRHKPRQVEVTAWRAIDPSGAPVGHGTRLPVELKPRRRSDGRIVAWRAFTSLAPPPDYYLDLYARWRSVCHGPRDLLYRYHVAAEAT
jgi:hypothetical protein